MSQSDFVSIYANEIKTELLTGHAREHAYRPALKKLLDSLDDAQAVNDPKRSEHGSPDYIIFKKSNVKIVIGYGEAKDIDVDLDKTEKTDQMHRYGGYNKLFLTNYLEFRFFQNGEKYRAIEIGKLVDGKAELFPEKFDELQSELKAFLELPPERIRSGKRLAEIMGEKGKRIRHNVSQFMEQSSDRNAELEKIYQMMRTLLVHDLTAEKFADMYSQTLVYGLFVARYGDKTPRNFTRFEARDLVPASNPFLRHFFDHIVGPDFDTRLGYIVDELCEVFEVSDVKDIVHKHFKVTNENSSDKDPIIHFYEDFLKEYDPAERKRMGAYFTPIPVVRFIIGQVDAVLKRDFGLAKGIADTSKRTIEIDRGQTVQIRDSKTGKLEKTSIEKQEVHKVQILDPATGTATFLNEIIKYIHEGFAGQAGRWPSYAVNDLIPRLNGFELMMAPYTIAHLKLGITLQETGVDNLSSRLGVYLTNTLEEGIKRQPDLFAFGLANAVSEEAAEAAKIKHERPIMVIVGNPPYSGVSSTETEYANRLISKYKVEPGGQQKLQERKHWLNDDYVKFIAFAEDMIAKNGEGIVAMITNHGFLDNPTFRGMRWHLAKTFDTIYILDLHGNSKKKETAPDGGKDENVFDIQQGVAIMIAVKTGQKTAGHPAIVYHSELFGSRKRKFVELATEPTWKQLKLDPHYLYFIPKSTIGKSEYGKGISVSDLFNLQTTGIVTMGDNFIVAEDKRTLEQRINKLASGGYNLQALNAEFGLGKNYGKWVIGNAKSIEFDPSKIVILSYRPFDKRYTYFDNKLVWRPRTNVMQHFLDGKNLGLLIKRQGKQAFSYIFVTDKLAESCVFESAYANNTVCPLYIYHDDGTRTPNFQPEVLKQFTANLQKPYEPEDILDYIYAILHSPKYRRKYQEFLKSDFPRVPAPTDDAELHRLAGFGKQLRDLHLMTSPLLNNLDTTYPIAGTDEVDKITYTDGQVWINDRQYFGNVPEIAWNFYIGGYQPAQKWLKDRKSRRLTNEDIEHYEKIIKVLSETDKLMRTMDLQI